MSREREQELRRLLDSSDIRSRRDATFTDLITAAQEQSFELTEADLKWFASYSQDGYFVPPDWLLAFLRRFLKKRNINSILNPTETFGFLTQPLATATQASQVEAIVNNADTYQFLEQQYANSMVNWHLLQQNEALAWLSEQETRYDLIIGFPPLGIRERQYAGDQLNFTRPEEYAHVLIANACIKLSEQGIGVFILTDRMFFESSQLTERLNEQGLFVNAVLGLPPGTLRFAHISLNLVVISHHRTDTYFVAELTDNEKRNNGVINLLQQHRATDEPTMGQLVQPKDFINVRAAISLAKLKITAERLDLRPLPLIDLAIEFNRQHRHRPYGIEHKTNSIYIPAILGNVGKVQTLPDSMERPDYWQVVLKSDAANAEFIARLLNTPLGRMMLNSVSMGSMVAINHRGLEQLQLFLPDIEVQNHIVQADVQIDNLIRDLAELKEELWSTPQANSEVEQKLQSIIGEEIDQRERFEDWIKSLPFPLASILWAYHATNDPFKKYRLLQRYFEGLTQFMATVLLSGFYNAEEWIVSRRSLFNKNSDKGELDSRITHASFGIWKDITQAFVNDLHKYLNTDVDKPTELQISQRQRCEAIFAANAVIIEKLFPTKLIDVLSDTNTLRNEWRGHGGLDDSVAVERLIQLEVQLNATREVLGRSWSQYRLIKPVSSKKIAGKIHQDVKLLTGHQNPFVTVTIQLDEQLDNTFLYLHSPNELRAMKVQPLIHILEKAVGDQNAGYFYSRVKKSDVVYVSHHYEREPDITEHFRETIELIEALKQLGTDGEE